MKLPGDFIRRIYSQEYLNPEALLKALEMPSPASIRINPAKWKRKPSGSNQVPWCGTGYNLGRRPSYTLDPLYHSGCYYPQEASGMFLEQVFRQVAGLQKKLKVLDLCGAPGGKSTHISSLSGRDSLLVSNEVIKTRATVLAENVTRWGMSNTIVTQNDPSDFAKLPGFFDVLLIDAPCSGEGMFRDPVAVREWSAADSSLCSQRQKRILMDAWPALKENGTLIYSTCTFNPDENEKNIEWLLDKHDGEIVRLDITDFNGVTEVKHNGITGYGFYPDKIEGEGFFLSVLRKREISSDKVTFINKKNDIKHLKEDVLLAEKLINITGKNLEKFGETVFLVPCENADYQIIKQNLRIVSPGVKLFTVKNKDFLPAHELALSCDLKSSVFPVAELDYDQATAYLRRENIKTDHKFGGWFIAAYQGANLGFAKDVGNRINNYYPVGLRIRIRSAADDKEKLISWL